jgi:hypothetical protein
MGDKSLIYKRKKKNGFSSSKANAYCYDVTVDSRNGRDVLGERLAPIVKGANCEMTD